MELEATLAIRVRPAPDMPQRLAAALRAVGVPLLVGLVLFVAWRIRWELPYTSGSDLGYWLGVVGGVLMLTLLAYPVRKRWRALDLFGCLPSWFRFHLVGGILGPLIVVFHSTFRIGSFNAAIALASMLLVVASGLVGRFLYRRVHQDLFGSRATLTQVQQALGRQMEVLDPLLAGFPEVRREIEAYSALVSHQPEGHWGRCRHFLSLGGERLRAGRRIHRVMGRLDGVRGGMDLRLLAGTVEAALAAAQRTAQFSVYERLFALWHVVHVPFLVLLVLTAIAHVVAVHAY